MKLTIEKNKSDKDMFFFKFDNGISTRTDISIHKSALSYISDLIKTTGWETIEVDNIVGDVFH